MVFKNRTGKDPETKWWVFERLQSPCLIHELICLLTRHDVSSNKSHLLYVFLLLPMTSDVRFQSLAFYFDHVIPMLNLYILFILVHVQKPVVYMNYTLMKNVFLDN